MNGTPLEAMSMEALLSGFENYQVLGIRFFKLVYWPFEYQPPGSGRTKDKWIAEATANGRPIEAVGDTAKEALVALAKRITKNKY